MINTVVFILGFESKRTTLGCVHFTNGLKKIVMTIIREVVHSGLCCPILSTVLIKYFIQIIYSIFTFKLNINLRIYLNTPRQTYAYIFGKDFHHLHPN